MNAEPIRNHRMYYRPGRGLADGPPVDILSIHGYGNRGVRPDSAGYAYGGGTFADADDEPGGEGNLNGLRGNAATGFAVQPSYAAYQQAASAL